MKLKIRLRALVLTLGTFAGVAAVGGRPDYPAEISKVWPAGMERGHTATFTIDGRSLSGAKDVIFDSPGITAKISEITVVPEKIAGPRAGVDTAAQVPQGKKETAKLEVTVAKDVEPGIHRFRIQTPLGTSNMAAMAIGSLPEITIRREAVGRFGGAS